MEEYTAQEDRIMKNASIIATALSGLIVMTSPLFAGERVFRVGKAGIKVEIGIEDENASK